MIKRLILVAAAAIALFLLQTSFAPHFPFSRENGLNGRISLLCRWFYSRFLSAAGTI